MGNFVNGWQNSIIKVFDQDNIKLADEEFPECNEDGFIEKHDWNEIRKEKLNYNINQDFKGWRVEFILHYNSWITKETLLKFKNVVDAYCVNTKQRRIMITPRRDDPRRVFNVIYTGEPIEIGNLKGGKYSIGNYMPIISFMTKGVLSEFSVSDPDNIQFVSSIACEEF